MLRRKRGDANHRPAIALLAQFLQFFHSSPRVSRAHAKSSVLLAAGAVNRAICGEALQSFIGIGRHRLFTGLDLADPPEMKTRSLPFTAFDHKRQVV
ncbi:hypothetical protein KSP40_PGU011839 [Platanthera guangdongensis]|uniref:Uncharacterized protein n=1 Tax=Platanthera guangdongensis TaxID=2320717 RepID=A0ABR2LV38_9ASPA